MLWEDKIKEIINGSIYDFVNESRKVEIEDIGIRWDFYNGYQQRYLRKFRDETEEEYKEKLKFEYNYTALVVDEYVNYVFGKPFSLIFEDEEINAIWEDIYGKLVFNKMPVFMMTVQRIAEISDTCGVIVRWDNKNNEIVFEHVRGEYIFPLPDKENPNKIGEIAIFYNYDTGDPKDPYHNYLEIWNKETFSLYKWSEKTKKPIGTPIVNEVNPYGFIPITLFQPKKDDNSFYGITNIGDIVNINKNYNDMWTDLGRMIDDQSFSTMVVRTSKKLDFVIGPRRLLKIDEVDPEESKGEEAKYITPDPKIDSVMNTIKTIKDELKSISLMPDLDRQGSSQPQSGFSLKIKRMPFDDFIQTKKASYGPSMLNLAKMAINIYYYNTNAGTMPDNNKLAATLDFSEMDSTNSEQEQITRDEFDLRYNLITPIDLMIRNNPDLTVEQAKDSYMKNKEFNEGEKEEKEEIEPKNILNEDEDEKEEDDDKK
jgi:hypothetical protein